jgi:hypothetical protein
VNDERTMGRGAVVAVAAFWCFASLAPLSALVFAPERCAAWSRWLCTHL